MNKLILLFLVILISFISIYPQVRVRGYFRKDGTYVQPHYRSYPDGNVFNNWSTKGNINPYTGKEGTIDPYRNSIPKTRVYSNYIHYPYLDNDIIIKDEKNREEIITSDSKEYLIIRRISSSPSSSRIKSNRIIIYD